ncbi:hypothetical protein OAG91_00430 [bacterium]|nr:hypothetical protein [bacterium]
MKPGDDSRILVREVLRLPGILTEMIELRVGAIQIDEVFPVSVTDSEVGIVLIESMAITGGVAPSGDPAPPLLPAPSPTTVPPG